jgi:hypothetical protein
MDIRPVLARFDLLFAWYDFWIGVYIDTVRARIYVFPVPCFGVVFDYGTVDRPAPDGRR